MQRLWAPWREEFIFGQKKSRCIFCHSLKSKKDSLNFIVKRGKNNFVILNLYPYNTGHLMAVPNRHVGNLEDLTEFEALELMTLTTESVRALKKALKPEGFNVGLNLERAAGAGIADHIHIHIVPRWNGDTNFMPVLGRTKVLSLGLETVYSKLKKALK